MDGYAAFRSDFEQGSGNNKGLEGITINPTTGVVYVLKEGAPRMLLEIAPDLASITAHRQLSAAAGFRASGVSDDDLDVSGIAYDASRDRFWIVSDVGRRLFLYDMADDKAQGVDLMFQKENN